METFKELEKLPGNIYSYIFIQIGEKCRLHVLPLEFAIKVVLENLAKSVNWDLGIWFLDTLHVH